MAGIKLITPPGMLLTVALLAIYAVCAWSIGWIEQSVPLLVGSAVSALACVGVAILKPWSRYLVYALAVGFIAKMGESFYVGLRSGYFDFIFESRTEALASLLPSVAMALLSLACCWLVSQHFSRVLPALNSRDSDDC